MWGGTGTHLSNNNEGQHPKVKKEVMDVTKPSLGFMTYKKKER